MCVCGCYAPDVYLQSVVIMAALRSICGHYIFCPVSFFFFLLFPSPNVSGRRLDVYHTSTHGVALARI